MSCCVRNILTKNYQNLVIGFKVAVKNVGDVFLRHSVLQLPICVELALCFTNYVIIDSLWAEFVAYRTVIREAVGAVCLHNMQPSALSSA